MSSDSAIKLALKARAARQQAAAALAADPIAIVGIGCRLPGGVRRPADYWRLLSEGRDAVRKAPADRWDADALYDADMSAPGRSVTREGGFIDDIDRFDADYFDILGREAEQMDPQQRLFLEVASEAIDDAGLTHEGLAGSRTGVYVASYHNDYAGLVYGDRDALDLRSLTGTLHSVLANRLSWHLDLRGPSLSIDTACSSSLVAIHLACQSLRSGETDLALAGGVSLMITPDMMVSMSKVGFMSPDGRCKTFDSSADGFGRGEGCGVAVFKRLADALADGDRVLAVVRSSCVNQDGRSTVLTAPSGPAQVALLREALGLAQIDAARVGFVETHGTGTALGDPIEVEAIVAALGGLGEATGPCYLGSAKANIGHLEAAAGVAGLIKTVLALRHGAVPPQVHYRGINPHIDLRGTRFAVPTALTPWPAGPLPRVATVSGFGVGGTNAHVIVEEAPQLPDESSEETDGSGWRLLPLSARSADALVDLESAWRADLTTSQEMFGDLCFTAGEHRTHYSFRRAFVAKSSADLGKRLAASLAEAAPPVRRPRASAHRLRVLRTGSAMVRHGATTHRSRARLSREDGGLRRIAAQTGGLVAARGTFGGRRCIPALEDRNRAAGAVQPSGIRGGAAGELGNFSLPPSSATASAKSRPCTRRAFSISKKRCGSSGCAEMPCSAPPARGAWRRRASPRRMRWISYAAIPGLTSPPSTDRAASCLRARLIASTPHSRNSTRARLPADGCLSTMRFTARRWICHAAHSRPRSASRRRGRPKRRSTRP